MLSTRTVVLKAVQARPLDNGTFAIVLPCREMSKEEHETLRALFPNTASGVERLLATEALTQSVVMD